MTVDFGGPEKLLKTMTTIFSVTAPGSHGQPVLEGHSKYPLVVYRFRRTSLGDRNFWPAH
ncbi:hypothetical protein N7457_001510 [Penicillium paradoxum]|uniref:uncharacterized protein n=1 Tax=Penicillium paradoxum TaxID=176176 RepID=UPI002547A732|nr:uncharacterized protein N7457_001510 [Penicillium paradoxum]KAJ5794911.1 hypothetical protein N7457_001510 [Penicillium paradoxum]